MEMQFETREIPWLRKVLCQVQNLEQTQQLRLPEGSSGAERILGTWGQVVLRSKEWHMDTVTASGGVTVWVLYEDGEGGAPGCLESWIPFRMGWDLPEDCPEGKIALLPLLRYADARIVSAGKVLVRVGVGVQARCWCPERTEVTVPVPAGDGPELRMTRWPLRLVKEAGEKAFDLEEELAVPDPKPEKLLYWRMAPAVTERKVLGQRLVFRGCGNLRLTWLTAQGQVCSGEFDLPFSQFTELEEMPEGDAEAELQPVLTRLEPELTAEGRVLLRASMTVQYRIRQAELVETAAEAWCPRRELETETGSVTLDTVLDSRREILTGEAQAPARVASLVDADFLPDFPGCRRDGDTAVLEQSGTVQLLYYDTEGALQCLRQKWTGSSRLRADGSVQPELQLLGGGPQVQPGRDGVMIRAEVPLQVVSCCGQRIPMVTAVRMGAVRQPDPGRPSVILCRSGESLWDTARRCGSTVAAIREANSLTGEPEPGRMLLVPVV